jgi:AcrR family transcriptional regulator
MKARSSRDRLRDAVLELVAKRGYRDTTVGDIEAAAGLTRRAGGFYRHFPSKEAALVQALQEMASEMVAEIRLEDVAALKAPRAELVVIAQALIRHAERYRSMRLILQREGHKLRGLAKTAQRANAKLANLDIVPWVTDTLRQSGITAHEPREVALLIFGPILLHILSLDRGDPAFGLRTDVFLSSWADHWAAWLNRGGDS